MSDERTRRSFLVTTGAFSAGALIDPAFGADAATAYSDTPDTAEPSPVGPGWPSQAPELAREMVGVSHGNVARVRELLARWPTLANANWDWGFGDWESALGAASHVGNREIAELLITTGARPTLFSATMLGQLDVVRAQVTASPGVQRIPGPHGITLLAHARAGGEPAAPVARYLESLGDADRKPELAPLAEADAALLPGVYAFGAADDQRIDIGTNRFGLYAQRRGQSPRNLSHVGDLAFFPAGAAAVRIRFERAGDRVAALTIHDPDPILRAVRSAEPLPTPD